MFVKLSMSKHVEAVDKCQIKFNTLLTISEKLEKA